MSRKLWTESENNIIIQGRERGLSYKEIAPQLPDRTFRSICVQGAKICSKGATKTWTDEEELRLVELRDKGLTNQQIADIMGRSHSAVKTKASQFIKEGLLEPLRSPPGRHILDCEGGVDTKEFYRENQLPEQYTLF